MNQRLALIVAAIGFARAAAAWTVWSDATYVEAGANDGDSFLVASGAMQIMARLYFVDTPEAISDADTDRRRLLEQARYFGVTDPSRVLEIGRAASRRTRELLAGHAFTLHTVHAAAPGRSGRPREYVMITLPDGRDLAAVLVQEGIARVQGVRRERPDGTSADDYAAHLADLELAAALQKQGVWRHTEPARLAALRQSERDEEQALAKVFGAASLDHPLDVNTCSVEDLDKLKGIGPVLAQRIVEGRPYQRIEDLARVKGLSKESLDRIRVYLTVGN